MLFILRQVVADREPWRLGGNENMFAWAYGRIVNEGSHGHVDEVAVANDRVEQRAAHLAARVVSALFTKDLQALFALGDAQLVALDAGKRLKGRTRRSAAVRAVAVQGVEKFVRHRVLDGTTQARTRERRAAR